MQDLEIEYKPLADLIPYARNARTHSPEQVAQIAASIKSFGFTNPVLIDGDNGIIAGHGRVLAAELLGMESVPTIALPHLTETQKRMYVISDNAIALNSGWDLAILSEELRALDTGEIDLGLTGFNAIELEGLMAWSQGGNRGNTHPDAVPDLPAAPTSQLGDLWILDRHRVLCGDCTTTMAYHQLLGEERAEMVWTDPPYNVDYRGKGELNNRNAGAADPAPILNDNLTDCGFKTFLAAFYQAVWRYLTEGGAIYVAHAETERANFTTEFLAAGFKLSGVVIWRKNALVLGRSDYQWIHEPILYGWKPGAKHRWHGGRKNTTVAQFGDDSPFTALPDGRYFLRIAGRLFIVQGDALITDIDPSMVDMDKPARNDVHPTMKPVALIEKMLTNSAIPGSLILDPFGGSGSTLIAAERLRMRARLIELSPAYVDVIVKRWQDFTGKAAVHDTTGLSFEELKKQRAEKTDA